MILLIGCEALTGKEIARLPVNQISLDTTHLFIKEATLDLKNGDKINIWSDMDIEYDGDASLRFKIEIQKNGHNLGVLTIDPMKKNITLGEIKTTLNNKTNWSFSGKNSEFNIDGDGTYKFRAILISSGNPTLKIKKAEVVFKK